MKRNKSAEASNSPKPAKKEVESAIIGKKKRTTKLEKKSMLVEIVQTLSGLSFCWWGCGTLTTFIMAEYFMKEEDFENYFLLTAEPTNLLQPFRALLAASEFGHMLTAAPIMIFGGILLQRSMGNRRATRFWQVSLLSCFVCLWFFGPSSPCFDWHIRVYFPFRSDGIIEAKRGIFAPDLMAECLLYLLLWNNQNTLVLAVLLIMDILYFGPLGFAMPISLFLFLKLVDNKGWK